MKRPPRHCLLLLSIGVLLLLALIGAGRATLRAQDDDVISLSREHRIKAAYLYQFGRYVEWPRRAFPKAKSPFVIGVMKKHPIAVHLKQIAKIKKIQNRPIQIRGFALPVDEWPCHILFLPKSVPSKTQVKIIHTIKKGGKHDVLLVGEAEGFLEWGGAIRFVVEDNKVRIYVAKKVTKSKDLAISAKLLQVARVVN